VEEMPSGSLSVDEKTAILIKSYELEPLPKLSLEIGESATVNVLNSGQYLGHLYRKRNLYWLGIDAIVELLDRDTAKAIRDDPVYGFSHYLVDRGVANVFGKQIFEGKMPLEPAIGAASAIGIVEQDRHSGKTSVYTKKQLGIDSKSVRDIAKKFHSEGMEDSGMGKIKDLDNKDRSVKENYEIARDMILKKKEEEEKKLLEEDMEPSWIKSDADILAQQVLKREQTPQLKGEREAGIPLWHRKDRIIDIEPEEEYEVDDEELYEEPEKDEYIVPFDEQEEDEEDYDDEAEQDEYDQDEYILPFETKRKKNDDDEDIRLPF
jgi:hypothetical protein